MVIIGESREDAERHEYGNRPLPGGPVIHWWTGDMPCEVLPPTKVLCRETDGKHTVMMTLFTHWFTYGLTHPAK